MYAAFTQTKDICAKSFERDQYYDYLLPVC